MMNIFKKMLIVPAFLIVMMVFPMNSQAAGVDDQGTVTPYPLAIDSASLTGNTREDVLTIAASQVGYQEAQDSDGDKYTWYAQWCDTNQTNWCSEFASWCAYMAGMPEDLFPQSTCVEDYRDKFGVMGQVFVLDIGNSNSYTWVSPYYTKTITLSDIQPGDIISIRRNAADTDYSPKHTCIVRSVNTTDQTINTYDGNRGSSKLKKVVTSTFDASTVYAVIKPMYELYPLDGIVVKTDAKGSVSLSWNIRNGVNGYHIYRRTKSSSDDGDNGEYELIAEINDPLTSSYSDTTAVKGSIYAYKIVPYMISASGRTFDGMSFNPSAYSSDTGEALPSECSHRYLPQETSKGTCVKKNTVTYTCIYCGDGYVKREVYGDHKYKKSVYVKASVYAPGIYLYKCSRCGDTYTKTYNKSSFTVGGIKYHKISSSKVEVKGASKKSVTSITIPKKVMFNGKTYKVTRIASKAFYKYKKLKTITINANITDIRSRAFYKCTKLKKITFTTITVPTVNSKAFKGIRSKAVFYVPKSYTTAFKNALKNSGRPSKSKIKKIPSKTTI